MNHRVHAMLAALALATAGCPDTSDPETEADDDHSDDDDHGDDDDTTDDDCEPVLLPEEIDFNCVGFVTGTPEAAELVRAVGAAWARPHPGPFAWGSIEASPGSIDYSKADGWVMEAQQWDVAVLGTIWPYADWDQTACHDSSCQVTSEDIFYPDGSGGVPAYRCIPCDTMAYREFVGRLVERYDGDGIDDMPGLEIPIRYWEILNEPEYQESPSTFFRGPPEDYTMVLQDTYEAGLTACPDCQFLSAALASVGETSAWFWTGAVEAGAYAFFDIGNVHYVDEVDGELDSLNVHAYLDLWGGAAAFDRKVWVTEAEFASESEVLDAFDGALSAGASKVFMTEFEMGTYDEPDVSDITEVYFELPARCDR